MNKTIKIIDLLNKIANGEEVPEKVKYGGIIYTYQRVNKHCLQYEDMMKESDEFWRYLATNVSDVNDTVEIIEEQEEIDIDIIRGWGLATDYKDFETINHTLNRFGNKINELVQAVKQLDKNIKEK